MPTPTHLTRLLLGLMASATALAQTIPSPPASAAVAAEEDTIELSEFIITSEKTAGYRATNAITATGIGARIADVPISISVVTSELLQDTNLFEVREALNFVPGVVTNPRSESTFVVRGFGGNISYRNGQYRRQLLTTWNTDRVEVIKGPASIFFGAVRPGGIINFVTIKPEFSGTHTDTKLTVGNESHYQAEVYHNQVVSDKLALRVGGGWIDVGGERQFEYKKEYYFGASALWKPTPRQQITFDVESINRELFYLSAYPVRALANSKVYGNPAAIAAQASVNQTTTTADTANRNFLNTLGFSGTPGAANFYPLYDMFAPYNYGTAVAHDAKQTQESQSVDLDYLLKIRDNLVFQSTLNYALDDTAGLQPSAGETRPYANGSVRFRTEDFINVRDSYNIHNKLTWRFDLGPTKHTLQLGQEYQSVIFSRPGYFDSQSRYNDSPLGAFTYNFTPGVSQPLSLTALHAAGGQGFNIVRKSWDNMVGYFIVDQARFFNERLFVLAGARYNDFSGKREFSRPVSNSSLSPTAPGGVINRDVVGAEGGWTPQSGILFKIIPDVSLFATYSESIEPVFQLDADGNPLEPVQSQSLDFGVKSELLDGRLTSTVTYYDIARQNLSYRDTARELASNGRFPYYLFGNEEMSRGYEAEVNWAPIDNYNLLVGYSDVIDAKVTKSASAPLSVGRRFSYVPDTFFLWNRYSVKSGPLNGLTIGFGARHNTATNLSPDVQTAVTVPSFTVYDAMISYKMKLSGRDLRLQFNVKNLTDELYREGSDGFFGQARTFYLSAATRF